MAIVQWEVTETLEDHNFVGKMRWPTQNRMPTGTKSQMEMQHHLDTKICR
jgi:hypothetical protein